ncbi:MAG: hypothetical protein FJ297_01565 [Planctomycetes bacterium]|nr:hypothetical protein [Planctomycetota bacterium]
MGAYATGWSAARKTLGRGELKIIEGGNHITTLSNPEFGESIKTFLRSGKLERAAGAGCKSTTNDTNDTNPTKKDQESAEPSGFARRGGSPEPALTHRAVRNKLR